MYRSLYEFLIWDVGARKDIKVATRELLYNYSKQFEDLKLSHSLPSSPRKRKSQKGKEVSVSSPQGQSSHVDGKLEGQKKTKKQKLDEDLVKNIDTESMKEDDGIPDIKTLKKKKNEAKQKTGLDTKEVNKAASRTLAAIGMILFYFHTCQWFFPFLKPTSVNWSPRRVGVLIWPK